MRRQRRALRLRAGAWRSGCGRAGCWWGLGVCRRCVGGGRGRGAGGWGRFAGHGGNGSHGASGGTIATCLGRPLRRQRGWANRACRALFAAGSRACRRARGSARALCRGRGTSCETCSAGLRRGPRRSLAGLPEASTGGSRRRRRAVTDRCRSCWTRLRRCLAHRGRATRTSGLCRLSDGRRRCRTVRPSRCPTATSHPRRFQSVLLWVSWSGRTCVGGR